MRSRFSSSRQLDRLDRPVRCLETSRPGWRRPCSTRCSTRRKRNRRGSRCRCATRRSRTATAPYCASSSVASLRRPWPGTSTVSRWGRGRTSRSTWTWGAARVRSSSSRCSPRTRENTCAKRRILSERQSHTAISLSAVSWQSFLKTMTHCAEIKPFCTRLSSTWHTVNISNHSEFTFVSKANNTQTVCRPWVYTRLSNPWHIVQKSDHFALVSQACDTLSRYQTTVGLHLFLKPVTHRLFVGHEFTHVSQAHDTLHRNQTTVNVNSFLKPTMHRLFVGSKFTLVCQTHNTLSTTFPFLCDCFW